MSIVTQVLRARQRYQQRHGVIPEQAPLYVCDTCGAALYAATAPAHHTAEDTPWVHAYVMGFELFSGPCQLDHEQAAREGD